MRGRRVINSLTKSACGVRYHIWMCYHILMETFVPSPESKHLKTPQEELAFLRERLAAKEQEVAALHRENPSLAEADPDKAHQDVIEEYKGTPHHQVLHKDFVMPKEQSEAIVLELSPEAHDEKIAELLGIMQTHGVKNALGIVERMNDPHVQDDFERFLVQYLKAGFPIQGMNEKTPEFKALHMTLYEITLPEKTDEGKVQALKEVVSSMEQFYSGMMSVNDPAGTGYFTIELAVASHNDDFSFNVAVHDAKKSIFEKQMLSIFHNAKIVEKKDDYNIFNEQGVTVA